jgi:NAD(P)H-hydrate repair Nnr-like enzyme with NAD(P)H-hydrate epimerase domain
LLKELNYTIEQLVEISGFYLALATTDIIKNHKVVKLLVMCGTGNNGADGISLSKFLISAGFEVSVFFSSSKLKDVNKVINYFNYS